MIVVAVVVIQAVSWLTIAALVVQLARRRVGTVALPVVVLIAAQAVISWDAVGDDVATRVGAAIANSALFVLFTIYPTGHAIPRWLVGVAIAGVGIQTANLATGLALEEQPWWPLVALVFWSVMIGFGQVRRYRSRSTAREREAVRWPILAYTVMVAGFLIWSILAAAGIAPFDGNWFANLLLVLPGLGFALGLLAPGSVDVDRPLWWALVLALPATTIGTVILLLGAVLAPIGAVPLTWLLVAVTAVLVPGLVWAARVLADRSVYGRRGGDTRAIRRLADDLARSAHPSSVPSTIATALHLALGGASTAVSVGGVTRGRGGPVSTAPAAAQTIVEYLGEPVGELKIWPRIGETRVTRADVELLARVGDLAAPALHGARVLVDLVDARARIVVAREEERKRLRRELHDDLAPAFSGLGLTASVVERYVASGDPRAGAATRELRDGLGTAARRLREIAYGLRPPVLDDRGLVPAIRNLESGESPEFSVISRLGDDFRAPAAIESAAFRIAQEAVLNARRHAAATTCEVTLTLRDGVLVVSISDDGIGLPDAVAAGIGLRSMRERAEELGGALTIDSSRGAGTVVEARLPLPAEEPR
jgi:signal transduction histidine kinase